MLLRYHDPTSKDTPTFAEVNQIITAFVYLLDATRMPDDSGWCVRIPAECNPRLANGQTQASVLSNSTNP